MLAHRIIAKELYITPVHRSGDLLDPDIYRPICVLSCLETVVTSVPNKRLQDAPKKCKIIH